MSGKSEAEKALQRKYALLRKKQAEAAANKTRPVPGQKDETKVDPVRQAAIAALKAKRASQAKGPASASHATPSTTAATPAKPTSATVAKSASGSLKLKFVIPKRAPDAPPPTAAPPPAAAPADVAPAKRPSLKRPAARQKPESTAAHPSSEHASMAEAKRPRPSDAAEGDVADAAPTSPTLWVGGLPEYYTDDDLWNVFSQFDNVVDVRVVPGYCCGYVAFETVDDAQGMLDFAGTQGGIVAEDRILPLAWARAGDGEADEAFGRGGGGAEGGGFGDTGTDDATRGLDGHVGKVRKAKDPRALAAEVAEQIDQHQLAEVHLEAPTSTRGLVSYDDL